MLVELLVVEGQEGLAIDGHEAVPLEIREHVPPTTVGTEDHELPGRLQGARDAGVEADFFAVFAA